MPGVRRRAPRRRRREAVAGARDAAARRPRGEGARAEDAQVDRRLEAEGRPERRVPGGGAARRRRRPRRSAGDDLLARRCRAVHHAAGRDHARPADRQQECRHVSDAGPRPAVDGHALAAAQGRPRRLHVQRRTARGRRRARARSGHRLLGERAAAEAHRRVHARGVPARCAGRARQVRERRPGGPGVGGDRARGLCRAGRPDRGGPVRRPHGLLHACGAVPRVPRDRTDDAARRDLSVDRGRQAAAGGRVARQGDRADLPAGDPDERARDRRLRPAGGGRIPQPGDRVDPQELPRARAAR